MRPPSLLIPLILLLGNLAPAGAQPPAQLSGIVFDPSGAAVPEAAVAIINEDTGFRRTAQSHADGRYVVASLHPGSYKITVRKEGFRTVVQFGVRLNPAEHTRVDLTLPLGSMQETVTVEGRPATIEREDAAAVTVLRREEIEQTPVSGRNLLALVEFAPGAVTTPATRGEAGQFTVNGQRPNSHYFTVDGVSVNTGVSGGGLPAQATGGSLPGMTAFGSLHGLASLDAIEEIRLETSSTRAELGRLPGAQVSIVSRSGSNELHGSLFHYFRSEKLDANDWFSNRLGAGRAALQFHDFGGAAGGPLKRNRTFFFASYEALRLRQPFVWRTSVPSAEVRERAPGWLQPVLRLFPAPNGRVLDPYTGEWTAHVDRPSRMEGRGLRLDHLLTSRISLFARYQDTPSSSDFGGWQVNALSMRSRGGTAGFNARITPRLIEDFRINALDARVDSYWLQSDRSALPECYLKSATAALTLGSYCESFFRFSIAGIGQVASGPESENRQRQWNAVQSLTWNTSRHEIRFGADFRRLTPVRRSSGTDLSVLSEGLASLLAGQNVWVATSTTGRAEGLLEEWSAYAQDTWRVSPKLTLTYGLRWELNPPPATTLPIFGLDNRSGPFAKPVEAEIWELRYSHFAPRVGIAFRPRRDGRTVVRAGAGLYYDSSLSIATDLVNGGPFNVWQFGGAATEQTGLARRVMSYGFVEDLRLPEIWQWNASVEHSLSGRDTLSAGYAGSLGGDLLRREMGGLGSTNFVRLALATNNGSSEYHSLQMQYRRRMARRVQALVSYAWAHSTDTSSADGAVHWVGSGLSARRDLGSSDFDVRHVLTSMATYTQPERTGAQGLSRLWNGWSAEGILRARTGFPINVLNAEHNLGVSFANVFRPDLAPGQPLWIRDPAAPGGRRLNREAFRPAGELAQGNLGRNALAGFGMAQVDLALQRTFRLGERPSLDARIEVFNLLNRANLADPVRFLSSPLFGEAPSMLNLMLGAGSPSSGLAPALGNGGPRSVQLVLRLRF